MTDLITRGVRVGRVRTRRRRDIVVAGGAVRGAAAVVAVVKEHIISI